MTDFFISYTQADRDWAVWIAWALEEKGYKTIIQDWDFRPGGNFVLDMQRAVAGADRTVAILSPDYLQSRFSAPEWAAAFAKDPTGEKGILLPVRVREVELEGLLPQVVYIDLVGLDQDTSRVRLLAGIKRERAKPARPPAFPGSSPPFPGSPKENPNPALPLDEIPDPGPLPVGSRMPFAHNPLFVGREEELRTLARQLRAGETSAVGEIKLAAASGLGGIGKTQLATEFVHRYGRYFEGGVFWMSFADPAAVPSEVAACGRSLDLHPSYDALPLDQQVQLVEDHWTRPVPRLLAFDNCDGEALLDRWRPRTGGTRVLITSRRQRWDRSLGVQSVQISTLLRPASIKLLRKFRPDLPKVDPALADIAAELGDLPLALHLAGSFLERYAEAPEGQPAAYLEALRQSGPLRHPSLQGTPAGLSPTSHEAHVGRTFALSIEKLKPTDETDALALALLTRAAYFASGDPIPRELLLKTIKLEPNSRLLAEDALARLTELGLLEAGKAGALVMHRLVAEFARGSDEGQEAKNAVEESLLIEATRPYPEHALGINEQALDAEHPDTAQSLNNLGALLQSQGDLAAARLYYERALAILEKGLGAEHPDTALSLNNLGFLLQGQAELAAAQPYYERALAIREKVLGAEHPDTARSLNNLGVLLQRQGDLAAARPFLERALAIREKVLGTEHPDTALSLNNLGSLLRIQGDLSAARPYFERALAIWEKVLGAEHPEAALSLNNLGFLLQSQGDLAAARPYYERALAIREKVLGGEHPDTALSLNNLGFLLQSQGDFAAARVYYERALAIRERVLGAEHPDTARSLSNLGGLLDSQGDLAAARPYYERALAVQEKVLGPEHPDNARILNNLGVLLRSQGDLLTARSYYERALAIFEARLGPDHPDTKIARENLAALRGAEST